MVNAKKLIGAFGACGYTPHYQPIVQCSHNSDSATVVGYESLCRKFSNAGMVGGFDLILEAKASGTLTTLDAYMARINLSVVESMPSGLFLSVNVSAQSLADMSLVRAIEEDNAFGGNLVFEITETEKLSKRDFTRMVNSVARLREKGWRVAIDDFGDGHSSLRYLNRIDVDIAKISRDALLDLKASPNEGRYQFMSDLVASLKSQNICTVLEGVEDQRDFGVGKFLGVDWMQGYMFGRPSADNLPGELARGFAPFTKAAL